MFGLLLLPMLQEKFHFIKVKELYGAYDLAPDDSFTVKNWKEGTYQDAKNKYVNDHIGLRPWLVRLNNQVDFSVFKIAHPGNVIVGKDGYLFLDAYVKDHFSQNIADTNLACDLMHKLKALQDTLENMGKTVLLVHAPSKADIFPEYLPDEVHYSRKNEGKTSRELFKYIGDSLGVHQLDMNSLLLSLKPKYGDLLISKHGIHWTQFGAAFAADSLIKYIEQARHIRMPHLVMKGRVRTIAKGKDDDIGQLVNLIFPAAADTLVYPDIAYVGDGMQTKPSAIYIGDSFVWTLIEDKMMENVNKHWQFWFYFHEMTDEERTARQISPLPIEQINWQEELEHTDCLIFVYTSYNLKELGNGFIEKAYDHYYPGN